MLEGFVVLGRRIDKDIIEAGFPRGQLLDESVLGRWFKPGEDLPVIGLGTSRTFDAGDDQAKRQELSEALQAFFDNGGTLIDSSPMYRSAEEVVGDLMPNMENVNGYFAATKVWIDGQEAGVEQMNKSMEQAESMHSLVTGKVHRLPLETCWSQAWRL